ncbi:BTB/POZ domain-containing protein POB1-like [Zingiber officinale]|uniref:BTB domain-containing protein n=1 Tax=Zingiber officinale TaxID=94328 RepID=A0A8J5ICA1_ZINOF|nr:BTB/POZ domain-containing protein POB1-like [Zingiber officinale]KAG6531514.1 hypothetical protein ZIOFF_005328 [Zingiber officinale]
MRESGGAPKLMIGRACDATDPRPSLVADNNFEFAFNSSTFSDRVLRLEVMAEPPDAGSSHRKRRRDDGTKEKALESAKCSSEFASNCEPKTHDCEEYENHNEDDVSAPHELTPSALQAVVDSENKDSSIMSSPCILRVIPIHINSAILSARSPFFYKLFSNCMKESEGQDTLLRINESEEAAFMKVLSFMYSGKLSNTFETPLLDVLKVADKFEVVSCMHYCSKLLRSLPVTTESALLYLDLPNSISLAYAIQPVIDAAKDFLVNSYKDIATFQDKIMNFPLAAIEAILSSDDLQVISEDDLYDFVLKWAHTQYTIVGERRDILSYRLLHHIRFAYLSCKKLREIVKCDGLDHDLASKLVIEALLFKFEAPSRRQALVNNELNHRRFVGRAYKCLIPKLVEFERPHPECIVYLYLKREECANLFPSGRLYSHGFHLGGQNFVLSANCDSDEHNPFRCFGLSLVMNETGSICCTVDYEVAARTMQLAGEFVIIKKRGRYILSGGTAITFPNLIEMKWSAFMAGDNPYFIDDTLHLRAEVSIKPPQLASVQ